MKVYVVCPKYSVTGGVELLHQLVYQLNKSDYVDASILYIGDSNRSDKSYIDAYSKYNNPYTEGFSYSNSYIHALIVPEIYTWMLNDPMYTKFKKVIYWESVDNYYRWTLTKNLFKFPKDTIHMAQSYYALDFLLNVANVDPTSVIYVTDYLNEDYLIDNFYIYNKDRSDKRVLYNPSKGYEYTNKIIKKMSTIDPSIEFTPIENMSREEVIDIMRKSKLYIDFGDHPGKDRIPREAAISGCCIITGKNGSAANRKDIPIKTMYKFSAENKNVEKICNMIIDVLNSYNVYIDDFSSYRDKILKEHKQFIKGVNELEARLLEVK